MQQRQLLIKVKNWLNELNQYIQNNKDYAISFIQKEIKDVYVVPTEATYLLWIDCHKSMYG